MFCVWIYKIYIRYLISYRTGLMKTRLFASSDRFIKLKTDLFEKFLLKNRSEKIFTMAKFSSHLLQAFSKYL